MNAINSFVQAQISVFGHSTEESTGIIQTEGDMNILFTNSVCKYISNKIYQKYFIEEIDADQRY
jgi:hypothetical protein